MGTRRELSLSVLLSWTSKLCGEGPLFIYLGLGEFGAKGCGLASAAQDCILELARGDEQPVQTPKVSSTLMTSQKAFDLATKSNEKAHNVVAFTAQKEVKACPHRLFGRFITTQETRQHRSTSPIDSCLVEKGKDIQGTCTD